ncbi:MAG: ABC transporter permease [Acidobacteriota bacterium]|nr:ABC transporter permease [Acidobacteriota bacterium]
MGNLFQDVKYGFQQLRRSPGLAAVAILTLALGIGATTAIFGVVNGWLLKPLPVPHPDQLTVMTAEQSGSLLTQFSLPDIRDYSEQRGPFADIFAYSPDMVGLTADRRTDQAFVSYVTGNYFSSLGLKPYLGRLILPSEGQTPGADPVIVLGYDYWQSRFNGDRGVIGKTVKVDGNAVTVIGVTPPDFHGTFTLVDTQAYMPVSMGVMDASLGKSIWTDRNARFLTVMGRLKPGTSVEEAQAAMNVEAARLAAQHPNTDRGYAIYVYPEPMARPPESHEYAKQGLIAMLFFALGAMVLLVACFNVASMLIARALGRRREMALRVSLGAGRGRLLRQTLVETLVLALVGGMAGLLLGAWLTGLINLLPLGSGTIPFRLGVSFDWRVYTFTLLICLATGVGVGLAPAFRAFHANPNEELREGGSRLSGGVRSGRLRRVLVVTQLAGSLVLLIVAGLFVRSLGKAETANPGFDPHGVLDLTMNPPEIGYTKEQTDQFYKRVLDRVRATPGVESAAFAFDVPFSYYHDDASVYIEGRVLAPGKHPPEIFFNRVTPGYFSTMRVAILRGRSFTDADDAAAPPVAIVNQAMAASYWPGQDPLGKRFRTSDKGPWISVVGVAGNASYLFVAFRDRPYYYVPVAQSYVGIRTLQIRSSLAPQSLGLQIQNEIRSMDPLVPVFDVNPLTTVIQGPNGFMLFRLGAAVAGGLGLLALVLAVVGLYGVVSYTVGQRRHEIAIRMAIGATARDVFADVLGGGGRMVAIGWAIGVLLAVLVARAASGILMGVSSLDPLTYIAASLALGLVALLACYLPARRATRVDPATALRHE